MARYREAIEWIADNDDTDWLDCPDGAPSVTLSLVADVFGKTIEQATEDLRRAMKRAERRERFAARMSNTGRLA